MISGIVITTAPEHLGEVMERLRDTGLCEVYFHDPSGRIVGVIDGEGGEEMKRLKGILNLEHVLSAEVAYSCGEGEDDEAFPLRGDV